MQYRMLIKPLTLQNIELTLQEGPSEQNRQFKHLLVIQLSQKKFDFSQNPMGMPLILFWGLKTARKGVSIAF